MDPLTLSRRDLYELVWSKPMIELAKDFGLSDVALAKRCRRLAIPVPGRGYWARIAAGQEPRRPTLPEKGNEQGDYFALTFSQAPSGAGDKPASSSTSDKDDALSRIAALVVTPTEELTSAALSAAVKRSARECGYARSSSLAWNSRIERSGPVLDLTVSDAVLPRALKLGDVLLRSAEQLGWAFVDAPKVVEDDIERSWRSRAEGPEPLRPTPNIGRLMVEGERIAFRIEERLKELPRVPTVGELAREKREYRYYAPRKTAVPTGGLRIVRFDPRYRYGEPTRKSWYDRKGRAVETQLGDVLRGFYELALDIRRRREEEEREAREREQEECRREALEERRAANTKLIEQLEAQTGAWFRASLLRRYLRALRRTLGTQRVSAKLGGESIDFVEWAEQFVDQLDPLHELPRNPDMIHEKGCYWRSDEEALRRLVSRLLGLHWHQTRKLGASTDATEEAYPDLVPTVTLDALPAT